MGPTFSSNSNCFYKMHTICNYRAEGTGNHCVRISHRFNTPLPLGPIIFSSLCLSFRFWKNTAIFISQKTFSSGYSGKLFIG